MALKKEDLKPSAEKAIEQIKAKKWCCVLCNKVPTKLLFNDKKKKKMLDSDTEFIDWYNSLST